MSLALVGARPAGADAAAAATLGAAEFAALVGVPADRLPEPCRARLGAADFGYTVLEGAARDAALLDALRALDADLPSAGPGRLPAWERGWSEVQARFERSGGEPGALLPQYFLERQGVMRLGGAYVQPAVPAFQPNFVGVLQAWVACRFLDPVEHVYEFGCGPGHNLVAFARLYPAKTYVGLDWAAASQAILARAAATLGARLSGRRFDMFAPDPDLDFPPGSAVVTVSAMEQLGERFEPFLDFLLARRPAICVHLEPLHELYDQSTLLDWVAARYAERRGYLRGYLPHLERLERQGRVEILDKRRLLGNLHHDGWGSLVWRPREGARG